MLNPSTADAVRDDPTIRRVIAFTRAWGFGWLVVVNLFALRATDPRALTGPGDPIGPLCDPGLRHWLEVGSVRVAAWGALRAPLRPRALAVLGMTEQPWSCLGVTRDGSPRHPLYVSGDTPLRAFHGERPGVR
jgi:hypothetical protein